MDAYHKKVAARLRELREAGENEKADELQATVDEIDKVLGK